LTCFLSFWLVESNYWVENPGVDQYVFVLMASNEILASQWFVGPVRASSRVRTHPLHSSAAIMCTPQLPSLPPAA
jgi:hypothetical protein